MNTRKKLTDSFYGSVTVGERGQIVIPAEARKKYEIEAGDKLLIMGTPHEAGLMLCKIDALREFMSTVLGDLARVEEIAQALPASALAEDAAEDEA